MADFGNRRQRYHGRDWGRGALLFKPLVVVAYVVFVIMNL